MLETINLALNPFDEHYIDRDLSRTGLTMAIVTPGTGHFAVNKNLLRLTTERMADHGISLDLVCLTKMPLHSVPLFSYTSTRPKTQSNLAKSHSSTPDLLYYDAPNVGSEEAPIADCFCECLGTPFQALLIHSHTALGQLFFLLENARQAFP